MFLGICFVLDVEIGLGGRCGRGRGREGEGEGEGMDKIGVPI